MARSKLVLTFLFGSGLFAQTHPLQELIEAARTQSPKLKDLLAAGLPLLQGRDGAAVWGQEFLFAVEADKPASVSVDKQPPVGMTSVPGTTTIPKPVGIGCPTGEPLPPVSGLTDACMGVGAT